MSAFPDLLNYDSLIAPGCLLLKDGGVMVAWTYTSADLDASTTAEREGVSARVNRALTLLETGHMLHVDVWRRETSGYPHEGHFPDSTTWLIDEERRTQYEAEGEHFENVYVLTLTWRPPHLATARATQFFYKEGNAISDVQLRIREIEQTASALEDRLSADLTLVRLTNEDLISHLHRCITGREGTIQLSGLPTNIDYLVGGYDLTGGAAPQIDGQHIRVVSVTGLPQGTIPAMNRTLNTPNFAFRWSTRWIALDVQDGKKIIKRKRRQWVTSLSSLWGMVGRPFQMGESRFKDLDSEDMAEEANTAMAQHGGGDVRYGFYTCVIVITEASAEKADEHAALIRRLLQQLEFVARIEQANTLDAWLGSFPGHGYQNVRRPMMNTTNLADVLPLWGMWTGEFFNPSDKFPPESPPICYGATTGSAPFRLHLHVSDVGSTLVIGPTGAGKTTLLSFLIAQWFRYEHARVYCLDRDYSNELITHAADGIHYDFLAQDEITLCPLDRVNEEEEREWAAGWIEWLLQLQGVIVTPVHRHAIVQALLLLAGCSSRSLSEYRLLLQDSEVKEGLRPYTLEGQCGRFFDDTQDRLLFSRLQTFELGHVLTSAPVYAEALFPYIFRHITRQLDGSPTLICVDEGRMLQNKRLYEQFLTWITTVRKKNAAVVLTMPSLTSLLELPGYQTILDSCPTKIFLPNDEARNPAVAEQYTQIGLAPGEIRAVADGQAKREYFISSPLGRRVVDFDLRQVALTFTGMSGPRMHGRLAQLRREHRESWQAVLLKEQGLTDAARKWREREMQRQQTQEIEAA